MGKGARSRFAADAGRCDKGQSGSRRRPLLCSTMVDATLGDPCRRMFVGGTLVLFLTTLIPAVAGNGSLHALQRQHIDTLWSKLTNVTSELVRCRAEVRASRNEAEEAGGAIQGAQESAENAKSGVKTMFQALQAQKKHAKVLSDHVIAEQQSSAKLRRQLRALQATNSSLAEWAAQAKRQLRERDKTIQRLTAALRSRSATMPTASSPSTSPRSRQQAPSPGAWAAIGKSLEAAARKAE